MLIALDLFMMRETEARTTRNESQTRLGLGRVSWVIAGLLALGISGCATRPDRNAMDLAVHLTFLEDQRTSKEETILQLGQPSGQYEGERILTWRLADDKEKTLVVVERQGVGGWETARYSLVLVFDDQEILKNHNLLRVR